MFRVVPARAAGNGANEADWPCSTGLGEGQRLIDPDAAGTAAIDLANSLMPHRKAPVTPKGTTSINSSFMSHRLRAFAGTVAPLLIALGLGDDGGHQLGLPARSLAGVLRVLS